MGSLTDHNSSQMSHQTQQYNEARESIIQTANLVFSSFSDLPKMVQNAKLLGEAAAILIRLINTKAGEAKDEDVRREMVAQAKKLAAVTQDMVTAIKTTVANPDDESQREMFRTAVDELISASNLATSNVIECTMKLTGTMKTYGADIRQIKYEMPAIQVGQVKYKTSEAQAAGAGNAKYQLSGMQSNVQQANIAQLPTVQVAQVHYQGAESQSSGGQVKYQLPAMQSGVQQSNIGQQVQFAQVQYQGTNAQQGGGQVKYQLQGVQSGVAQGNVVQGLPTVQVAQVQYSGAGQQPGSGQVTYQLAGATQGNIAQPNVAQRNVSQVKYQLPADQMRSDVRYVTMDGGQFAAMDSKHSTLDSRNATLGSNLSGQILILDSRYNTLDSSQYVSANSRGSTLDSTVTSSTMESFNESSVSTRADYSTRTDYSVKTNYVDESQVKYNYGVKKGLKGTALVNMNALSQDRKRKHDGDLEQEVRFVEEKKTIYEWGIDRGMSGKAIVNLDALSKRKKRMVRRKKFVEGYEEYEEYSDEYSDGDLEIDDDLDEKRRLARLRMEEPFIKRTTIIVEDNGEELDMEDVSPNFEAFFRNMKRGEPRDDVMKELEDAVDLSDIIQIDNLTPENLNEGLTEAEERKLSPENIPPDFSAFFATYIATYGWPSDPEVLGPGAKPIEELIDAQNLLKPDDPDRDGAESVLSEAEGGACGPDLLGGGGGPTKMFVLPDYDSYFRQAKAKPRGKFVQCDLGDDTSDGTRKIAVGFMIPYRRIVLACAPADQPRKKAQAQLVRVLKTFQSVAVKTIRAVLSTRTRVVYKRTYRRRRGGGGGESEKKSQAELQQDELMKKFREAKLKVKGREAESYGQAEGKLLESKASLASDAAEAKAAFLRFASVGIKGQSGGDGDDDASWSKTEVVVSRQSCAELAGLLMQFQQAYQDVLDASMILGKHTTVVWHQKCVVKTTKFFSFSATTVIKGARLFTSSSNISETKSNLALAAQDLTTSIDEMMGVCHERFPDENAVDAGNSVEPDKLLELLKAVTSHAPNSDVAEIKEFKELAAIMAESRGDTRMGKAVQARMELLATYLQNNPDYSGFDFAEYKKRILGF
ncbi:TLN1 [Branchiostoma lanceolatum]|uniref:TLN1 protein n=1 Tax=Branchiostoma lanceolatum TaxID=7740 RepID=A0A8J9ZEH1_BRALA|nr:TLN1 [Branchiostoma lanceolatum]